jgi:lauroyl/myristoyl acyltransferase
MQSFPGISLREATKLLEKFWYHHQRFFLELFWFMDLNEKFIEENITFGNLRYLVNALNEKKGAVLFVPHMGNERLIHLALAIKGYPVAVITGDFRNAGPYVRKVKLQTTRKFHPLFFPDDPPRSYIRFIREQHGILQISPPAEMAKKTTQVNLLNHKIHISTSAMRIARQTGAPVVPALCTREGVRNFKIAFHEPLFFSGEYEKNYGFQKELGTIYPWIETYVRKYPEQFNWLWLATNIAVEKDL